MNYFKLILLLGVLSSLFACDQGESSNDSGDSKNETSESQELDEVKSIAAYKANELKMEALIQTYAPIDEAKLLAQSKRENKPILIYFTGHICVNSKYFESSVLFETEVLQSIMENFIFVPLYVDDKTELPKEEQTEVIIQGMSKEMITVGNKNLYYEMSQFDSAVQPYFVVLNSEKEVLETTNYESSSVQDYLLFLNNALGKFSK